MALKLERIYTQPADLDGYRILVDRLWPRGMSKEKAHLDEWLKEVGPTKELRQWFNHERSFANTACSRGCANSVSGRCCSTRAIRQ